VRALLVPLRWPTGEEGLSPYLSHSGTRDKGVDRACNFAHLPLSPPVQWHLIGMM
jgi:hypothetical protein